MTAGNAAIAWSTSPRMVVRMVRTRIWASSPKLVLSCSAAVVSIILDFTVSKLTPVDSTLLARVLIALSCSIAALTKDLIANAPAAPIADKAMPAVLAPLLNPSMRALISLKAALALVISALTLTTISFAIVIQL